MKLYYLPSQEQVFFPSNPKRFTIVAKGRRVGLTRGAAQAFFEVGVTGAKNRLLWGETIFSNVQRYFDMYFMPLLDQIPRSMWEWRSKLMQLNVGDTVIDFRSADTPENWEGFGYNIIFLNEAGIIMRNPDLYKKTILPMMMDFPDSRLIAAGVPKGKKLKNGDIHPFYELWEKAGSNPAYVRYRFPTHTNKFLSPENIAEIEGVLDEKMQLQEIYGEFIDATDNPYLYCFEVDNHVVTTYQPSEREVLWFSFDFNIEPNSCIVGQQPNYKSGRVFDEVSVKGSTEAVCDVLLAKYSHWINRGMVIVTGDATGKNRNAMSGEVTNYKIIKAKLKLIDKQLRLKQTNMLLKSSRVLCNAILSKLDVSVTKNCTQVIIDCQTASVDGTGELIKESGLHKLDCFRYLLEAWFPDMLDKEYKYK